MRLQCESGDSRFLFTDLLERLSLVFAPAIVACLAQEFGRLERLLARCFDGRLGLAHELDFLLGEAARLMLWIGGDEVKSSPDWTVTGKIKIT